MDATGWVSFIGAVSAIGIGALALCQAHQANNLSADANRRAKLAESLMLEQNDVEWSSGYETDDAVWMIQNVGQTVAHDVHVTLDIDGSRLINNPGAAIPHKTQIRFDLNALATSFQAWEDSIVLDPEFDERGRPNPVSGSWTVTERISWRSERGRPYSIANTCRVYPL